MLALKNHFQKLDKSAKAQAGPIGLEFAYEEVHLVQLERCSSGKINLLASSAIPYPLAREQLLSSPKAVKTLLNRALKSAPFSGRDVVTTMMGNDIRLVSVTYNTKSGHSDGQSILKLLENRVDGELSDYVVDYMPIRQHAMQDERVALVALAKQDQVVQYLELVRAAGMNVMALDVSPSAINRLMTAISGEEHKDNILVINFGYKKSYMTLLSGRRLLFDQEIDCGEEEFLQQVSKTLDMDQAMALKLVHTHGLLAGQSERQSEMLSSLDISKTLLEVLKPKFIKLVEEINRALIYAAAETRGETVKHVYLLGSIARWKGADACLNQLVNIPVSLPDYFTVFNTDGHEYHEATPEMAVATGLALRGLMDNG